MLLLSLGRSAVYAVVNFVAALTQGPLSEQRAVMNRSLAPDRPWLDLVYQLLSVFFAVVPIALAAYLLVLRGGSLRLWWSRRHLGLDAGRGAVIAAAVGSVGLVFYLVTYAVGLNLAVVAQDLDDVWWRYPVLVLAALENAAVEELILLGFVLLRLEQLGMRSRTAVVVVAVLRGATTSTRGSAASSATSSWACSSAGCSCGGAGSRRSWSPTRCSTSVPSSGTPCSRRTSPGCQAEVMDLPDRTGLRIS